MVGPHGGKLDSIKVDSFTGDACAINHCYDELATFDNTERTHTVHMLEWKGSLECAECTVTK